jgi:hypothetical protein
VEVPDNVLAAIVAFVELQRSFNPDDTDYLVNHQPVLEAWLDGLGLLMPSDPELLWSADTEES